MKCLCDWKNISTAVLKMKVMMIMMIALVVKKVHSDRMMKVGIDEC